MRLHWGEELRKQSLRQADMAAGAVFRGDGGTRERRLRQRTDHMKQSFMSSLDRELDGDVRIHHLTRDQRLIDPALLARHGRSARTLVKEGPLRLTIVAIGPGGALPAHSTGGPITIHVLEGEVTVSALEQEHRLGSGDVLVLAPGIEHAARSVPGGVFLLTVVHPDSEAASGSADALDGPP